MGKFGGSPVKGKRQPQGNNGERKTPSTGPRAKAVAGVDVSVGKKAIREAWDNPV